MVGTALLRSAEVCMSMLESAGTYNGLLGFAVVSWCLQMSAKLCRDF